MPTSSNDLIPGTTLFSSAPGKLVLTGDYAVLLGAPTITLAINRYATVKLTVELDSGWRLDSSIGINAQASTLEELRKQPDQSMLDHLVNDLDASEPLPQNASLHLDTSNFYHGECKLGLGSSASVLVALATLFHRISGHTWTDTELSKIHNSVQNSNGSGLDVAAARHGGVIEFQKNSNTRSMSRNRDLHILYLFTQRSAQTGPMLQRFYKAIDTLPESSLDAWVELASQAVNSYGNTSLFLRNLNELNLFVERFDQSASLGIYSEEHQLANQIARQHDVLYKPSGAGGGDMGLALSEDPDALTRFAQAAQQHNLISIDLDIAPHGAVCEL